MKDISFIVLSFNARDLLFLCLESLTAIKTKYSTELIVVDNNSSDGSPDMVRENFKNVILIENEENFGFAKGNNIGIKESSGRYVCLINSDIIVSPDCVDKLVDYMEKNESVGIVSPKLLLHDSKLCNTCRNFPTVWNNICTIFAFDKIFPKSKFFTGEEMLYFNHDEIRKVEVIAGAFWLARRKSIQEVGLLDEKFFFYAEDSDWCKRFWDNGWEVVFFPYASSLHFHQGSSPISSNKLYIQRNRSKMYYWQKHYGILGKVEVYFLILLFQLSRIPVQIFYYIFRKSQREKMLMKLNLYLTCILWLFGLKKMNVSGNW